MRLADEALAERLLEVATNQHRQNILSPQLSTDYEIGMWNLMCSNCNDFTKELDLTP